MGSAQDLPHSLYRKLKILISLEYMMVHNSIPVLNTRESQIYVNFFLLRMIRIL